MRGILTVPASLHLSRRDYLVPDGEVVTILGVAEPGTPQAHAYVKLDGIRGEWLIPMSHLVTEPDDSVWPFDQQVH